MDAAPLLALARARRLARRARVFYRDAGGVTTEREVDVLGLAFGASGGDARWYAFVHCHLRSAVRLLRLDRVTAAHGTRRPARARPPRGFDPAFFASAAYLDAGAPVAHLATVRLEGPLATAAPALFPSALAERAGAALLCHVRASRPAVLAALVASLGNGAALLGPAGDGGSGGGADRAGAGRTPRTWDGA
ncbi:MAG: helix-turn-helix transcriptional regulator [Anaeromyxobacteraceae bacterium]